MRGWDGTRLQLFETSTGRRFARGRS
jgi:hypothetical protein